MLLTIEDFAGEWSGHPDFTAEVRKNAARLIEACNKLEELARADGVAFPDSPVTKTGISGSRYGGFRPQACTIGAPKSNHKTGLALDRYDPTGEIDSWCLRNLCKLEACGIWIESPTATQGWSHWQCVPPKSGRRVFLP